MNEENQTQQEDVQTEQSQQEEQVQTDQQEAHAEQGSDQSQMAEEQQQETQKSAQENLIALRKAKEAAEREREEVLEYVRSMRQNQQQAQAAPKKEEESFNLAPDDIPEWRHVNKSNESLKREIEQLKEQVTTSTTEAKLKAKYSDFDEVVNEENVRKLRESYPEVAATLNESKDLYNKASSAYTMIKRLVPQQAPSPQNRDKAIKNSQKPRPASTASGQSSDSPLSRANAFSNGMTDELREALWKEMKEYSR